MIETVNGYVCHNCSDVALAKRNVDPAHPKDGADGINAKAETGARDPAVVFGGKLVNNSAAAASDAPAPVGSPSFGSRIDLVI
jgi:hypothetical protein